MIRRADQLLGSKDCDDRGSFDVQTVVWHVDPGSLFRKVIPLLIFPFLPIFV